MNLGFESKWRVITEFQAEKWHNLTIVLRDLAAVCNRQGVTVWSKGNQLRKLLQKFRWDMVAENKMMAMELVKSGQLLGVFWRLRRQNFLADKKWDVGEIVELGNHSSEYGFKNRQGRAAINWDGRVLNVGWGGQELSLQCAGFACLLVISDLTLEFLIEKELWDYSNYNICLSG